MNKVKFFRREFLFELEYAINEFAEEKEIISVSTTIGVRPDNSPCTFYATVLYKDDDEGLV